MANRFSVYKSFFEISRVIQCKRNGLATQMLNNIRQTRLQNPIRDNDRHKIYLKCTFIARYIFGRSIQDDAQGRIQFVIR